MNATTVKGAKKHLDRLIEQVNADAEPTIIAEIRARKPYSSLLKNSIPGKRPCICSPTQ
jgi:hypothetical protein